jgi:molecular chaperone GrpE
MPDDDDKTNRMDAAKAFFRQMYAGNEEPAQSEGGESSSGGSAADSRRVRELEQQIKELEQRTNEAENLYKRMAADFDNFRRRMEREREDSANAGVRKAAEAIMPALDDLDRALLYLNPETPAEKVIESFQLVAGRILQCLDQVGLKRLNTKGAIFDPRFHEPVQQIETTEMPDGMIMHELRGGYSLGDRVIRPALVNVASNASLEIPPAQGLTGSGSSDAGSPASSTDSQSSGSGSDALPSGDATESESQTSSVATEEKLESSSSKTSSSVPDDKVYDLGDL